MNLIVIRTTNYQDKDILCDCISEQGPVCVQVKGGQDSKNKNSGFCNELGIFDATFVEGDYTNKILRSFTFISVPMKANSTLEYLCTVLLIQELSKNCIMDEDKKKIYHTLYDVIIKLKSSENPYMLALHYLAAITKLSGLTFEINKCVCCGSKKNIKAFSFMSGGFVCENCLNDKTDCRLNGEQMMLLREVYLKDDLNFVSSKCTNENAKAVINEFAIFIQDNLGVELKSVKLIK